MERWRYLKQHEAVSVIQRQMRRRLAFKVQRRLQLEQYSATRIQAAWRWRYRDHTYRRRQKAARTIQSFERMRNVRTFFINFNYDHLWLYRASRQLACVAQRLWLGHIARSSARQQIEMNRLPDPNDAHNFDAWLSYQKVANPPARTWGVYAEYVLSGQP